MRYISTRGAAPPVDFETALLNGLAPDGGLYLPERIPHFDAATLAAWRGRDYAELAAEVLRPFVADCVDAAELRAHVDAACANFDDAADPAPLRALNESRGEWILELFHGPTLSFKDYAMQLIGRMMDAALQRRGQRALVLGATSGDTGSAAIAAFADCRHADVVILHPHGRVSEVQRRQMCALEAPNVRNLALEGDFDDCQRLLKACFAERECLPERYGHLVAVNSINLLRVLAQTIYYFHTHLRLDVGEAGAVYSVPCGNFGNMYAAHLARRMGLPAARLVVAVNSNDVLHEFFSAGRYRRGDSVRATHASSMDISVASNLERLLFELFDGDGARLGEAMRDFADGEALQAPASAEILRAFGSCAVDDVEIRDAIAETLKADGYLLDPHTAVGVVAGRRCGGDAHPKVFVATAHPAKFPEALLAAGVEPPPPPPALAALDGRAERFEVMPASEEALKAYIGALQ